MCLNQRTTMKILFLCTANSCRSILAEALFNHLAPAGMRAFSAGSEPRGEINPLTLEALARAGIAADGLYSKSSDAHQALNPDFVITVCDKAAGEACPVYFGPATKAHWGLADPSESVGSPEEVEAAFDATLARLRLRIEAFLALPLAQLDAATLRAELARIGAL
jgi:arsenate reductase